MQKNFSTTQIEGMAFVKSKTSPALVFPVTVYLNYMQNKETALIWFELIEHFATFVIVLQSYAFVRFEISDFYFYFNSNITAFVTVTSEIFQIFRKIVITGKSIVISNIYS